MATFDDAIAGITQRFGALTATSPFTANPLGGANPFSGGDPFMASNPFGGSPFGQGGGSPFAGNPFGGGGGAFGGGNPFGGGGNAFGNNPFGGGSPFGEVNFGPSFNPYGPLAHENDPLGTGMGERKPPKSETSYPDNGGGVNFSGPATADDNAGLTGEAIDGYIARTRANSPLKGMGNYILQEANRQGVSVPMLMGIMLLESQLGADNSALPRSYNYGGLTGTGWRGQTGNTTGMARAFATFSNREDGVSALIANLASGLYRGKSVQQQIGLWYLGNENADLNATDEHGNATMAQYLSTVSSVYNGLGVGFNQNGKPTAVSTGMGRSGNWETIANSFTREGGGWVDYTNGGIRNTGNPKDGMDCSSFTGYVMGLDRGLWNAQAQADASRRNGSFGTNQTQMKKGDLVYFQGTNPNDQSARPVSHVGIYLGNGKMIHTGSPGRGVEVVSLNTPYWQKAFFGYGRP